MPTKIRALLTALVVILAILLWAARAQIGLAASALFFFGLVLLICLSIWLFPEVKKDARER